MHISERIQSVQTPVIPVIANLISANPDTISLGQGIVNYGPPPLSIEKIRRIKNTDDIHRYGNTEGMPELINKIKEKLRLENNINTDDQYKVLVTAGSNMAFLNVLFLITDPGDEILIARPYYFNHEMAINMVNCVTRFVSIYDDYQLNIDNLEASITEKTRAVVTISPNNPTGAVYPESTLREVNSICKKYDLYHISDEAYEYFTFDDTAHYSPGCDEDSSKHTISIFSFSKAYGLANWRMGYIVIPAHLYEPMLKVQDTNLICPDIIAQYAALGALETGKKYCTDHLDNLNRIRQNMITELACVKELCTVPTSQGALYLFAKLDTDMDDFDITKKLINDYRVAVLPGSAFGIQGSCYIRLSYGALSHEMAIAGIQRLIKGLKDIID